MKRRMTACLATVIVMLNVCAQVYAGQTQTGTPLGSPDFKPTPERPIGWRGDGTGLYPGVTKPPTVWSQDLEGHRKGIAWNVILPGYSPAMPIIVGNRIFVNTGCDLICLDKQSGKPVWADCCHLIHTLKPEEVKKGNLDSSMAKVQDHQQLLAAWLKNPGEATRDIHDKQAWEAVQSVVGSDKNRFTCGGGWGASSPGVPTPTSDGKFIWGWWSETGVLACYDLDGKRQWIQFLNSGSCEHNVNSSPLLLDEKVIIYGGGVCYGVDKKTGKVMWQTKSESGKPYASPVAMMVGNKKAAALPNGSVLNPADGSLIVAAPGNWHDGECASPVVDGKTYYIISRKGFSALKVPGTMGSGAAPIIDFELRSDVLKPPSAPNPDYPYPVASPVASQGIIWFTHSGWCSDYYHEKGAVLFAVDEKARKLLYRQELDMLDIWSNYNTFGGGQCASLTVAGKYLYIMSNVGVTLVLEVDKSFKKVAVNTIKFKTSRWGVPNELFISTPIFEGDRMYYRAYDNLYCITEPAK